MKLKEQEYLLDNVARINLEVTLPTATTVEAPVSVEVGDEFRVTGTLHGARGEPLEDRVVSVQIGGLPAQRVSTDAEGAFELTGALDSPGAVTVHAEFPGDGPVLQSQATARLSVLESSLLTLNGPSAIELGGGATFTGRLTTTADAPIAQSTLSIVDGGGAELATVTTDDDGGFSYEHEAFFQSGSQSLDGGVSRRRLHCGKLGALRLLRACADVDEPGGARNRAGLGDVHAARKPERRQRSACARCRGGGHRQRRAHAHDRRGRRFQCGKPWRCLSRAWRTRPTSRRSAWR